MSDEEVDAVCDAAMGDGWPLCPWAGQPEYDAHSKRRMTLGIQRMKELAANLREVLRMEGYGVE